MKRMSLVALTSFIAVLVTMLAIEGYGGDQLQMTAAKAKSAKSTANPCGAKQTRNPCAPKTRARPTLVPRKIPVPPIPARRVIRSIRSWSPALLAPNALLASGRS